MGRSFGLRAGRSSERNERLGRAILFRSPARQFQGLFACGYTAGMPMNDPRARQAMYMAKKPPSSSLRFGSGRALVWVIGMALVLAVAIWLFVSLL